MLRSVSALVVAAGLVLVPPPAVATDDVHPEWGHTTGHDARIKKGCHGYAYDYALTPPDGDWQLETFLIGPHGGRYGSGWFLTDDPLAATSTWRLCRQALEPGTYTIRAHLSVDNATAYYDGWLPDTTFRLTRKRHR